LVNFFTSLSCYSGINIFGIVNAFAETAVFSSPDASVKSVTVGHVTLADGANSEGIQKGSGSFTIDGTSYTPIKFSKKRQFNVTVAEGYEMCYTQYQCICKWREGQVRGC